jgi:two-component system, NarL family, sensor histidine kinase LiaS
MLSELEEQNQQLAVQLATISAQQARWPHEQVTLQSTDYRLALEEERGRIAMEIHDSVAQQLYGMVYTINGCLKLLPQRVDLVQEQLAHLLPTAQRATLALRRAIFDLWPEDLDAARFSTELRGYVEEVAPKSELQLFIQIDQGFSMLPMTMRRQLYRIAQEALNNTLAHAQAQRTKITLLTYPHEVVLRIADNGIGFESDQLQQRSDSTQQLGLTSMRERTAFLNGQFELDSILGQGVTVTITVPLNRR